MKKLLTILLICFFANALSAQSISKLSFASGTFIGGTGGNHIYAVLGEPVCGVFTNVNGTVSGGFLNNSTYVTSVNNIGGNDLLFSAFPNPSSNAITFKTEGLNYTVCVLQIFSLEGVLQKKELFTGQSFLTDISSLPAGIYLATIESAGNHIQSFRIVKTN